MDGSEAAVPQRGVPPLLSELLLVAGGCITTVIYGRVVYLSGYFEVGSSKVDRPIVTVLVLFSSAFALYLLAAWVARRVKPGRAAIWIWIFAVLFRLVMLRSTPIQEVDIYRYLWDGVVFANGVSPYKYAPEEILQHIPVAEDPHAAVHLPKDLRTLALVAASNPNIRQVLGRVHFRQIPTVYPPVSQLGFAAVTSVTPAAATVEQRLLRMRVWLVLCDLGALGVLALLLRRLHWHPAGALIYGWCPLVVKEIANSGHLDSMAVFATMCGVYGTVRCWQAMQQRSTYVWAILSGVCIALGIGAKIYPVALVPWVAVLWWAKMRFRLIVPFVIMAVATLVCLFPMMNRDQLRAGESLPTQQSGIEMFYRYWEMNDFLFLVAVENLKPINEESQQPAPWFAVTPNTVRQSLVRSFSGLSGWPEREAAFQVTRLLTMCLLAGLCLYWLWRVRASSEVADWLRVAFLCLAWFWMLCPTQNPWYWTWAIPLLPFARYRSWLLVSGVAMLYYLRFWFEYQFSETPVLGTPYAGTLFFDFVVPWIEFGPVLVLLAVEMVARRADPRKVGELAD